MNTFIRNSGLEQFRSNCTPPDGPTFAVPTATSPPNQVHCQPPTDKSTYLRYYTFKLSSACVCARVSGARDGWRGLGPLRGSVAARPPPRCHAVPAVSQGGVLTPPPLCKPSSSASSLLWSHTLPEPPGR